MLELKLNHVSKRGHWCQSAAVSIYTSLMVYQGQLNHFTVDGSTRDIISKLLAKNLQLYITMPIP